MVCFEVGTLFGTWYHWPALTIPGRCNLRMFTSGMFRIKQFVWEHDLTNRLHIYRWLLKMFAIPAGSYASQTWATPFLRQGKEVDKKKKKENYVGSGTTPYIY